ncbi:MAG: hypothetical protein GF334_11995 [Candidatus Altiarchaeales archaeon]|nr:hypothetical protein [Candidatus Altiarchaeales archaeon]
MPCAFRETPCGVVASVHVSCGLKKPYIRLDEFILKVGVVEPPISGQANAGVERLLTGLACGAKIVSGHKSRKKKVFFPNKTEKQLIDAIKRIQ